MFLLNCKLKFLIIADSIMQKISCVNQSQIDIHATGCVKRNVSGQAMTAQPLNTNGQNKKRK